MGAPGCPWLEALSVALTPVLSLLLGSLMSHILPVYFPSVSYFIFSHSGAFVFVSQVSFNFLKPPTILCETRVYSNKQIYTGSASTPG